MKHPQPSERAFTLVELLVVVGILILVTAGSLLVLEQTDDQMRYKKNEEDYKDLHTALFGPGTMTTINGNLVVSGYLADTGKLPNSLDDLVTRPIGLPSWSPVAPPLRGAKIHHGWRGPYLNVGGADPTDAWGNPWHFRLPVTTASPLQLGSWGRDGLPGGVEQYEDDFPKDHSIEPGYFTLTAVPIPVREVRRIKDGPLTVALGVIHAGMDMTQPFSRNGNYHSSLLRYPNTGEVVRITLNPPSDSNPSAGKKDKKDNGSGPTGTTTLAGLTYDLGYARQLQLVLYEEARTGIRLVDKLCSIDPMVVTYLPRVSTVGQERILEGTEAALWVVTD